MYVLKLTGTNPAIYISIDGGFISKTDTVSQAFQMNRIGDAQKFADIVVEATEIVSI
jgi:hypothetical protein